MAKSRRSKKSKLRAKRRRKQKRRSNSLQGFRKVAPVLLGTALSQIQ